MANLVDGKISDEPVAKLSRTGEFKRADSSFHGEIPLENATADRYHLYVSYACPWAHRTIIMRNFKDLEKIIPMSVTDPYMGDKGWTFSGLTDPKYLAVLYLATDKKYSGKITVPVLWDSVEKQIVNNESSEIIRIMNHAFDNLSGNTLDFYPESEREKIDELNDRIYEPVNNGVYKTGFASTQKAYEKNCTKLFETLEELDLHLEKNKYLVGDKITEADIRLFTTLIRFDPVYFGHFKCNVKQIRDFHHLYNFMKSLYQMSEIHITCNFEHIKKHYYESHKWINPTQIVPMGPLLDDLETPHDRGAPDFHHKQH